jgi:hypothetical protein
MSTADTIAPRISAIVPARNEEASIRGCVESLAEQSEIAEILVVNDQSTDRTEEMVGAVMATYPQVRLLQTNELPAGWVGKNNAVWLGAREAKGEWLLFTDADVVHEPDSVAKALEIATDWNAAMVSFSPEQVMEKWYEKALIPYVYCQLGKKFSFEEVNDPQKPAAAANGQFLLIRRDAYEAVGGHASVAGDVLEDVALAKLVKQAGFGIWFGSGEGIVRTRMYRSFPAMWEGWKKNLYRLMGGRKEAMAKGIATAVAPVMVAVIPTVIAGGLTSSVPDALLVLAAGILAISIAYEGELLRNQFASRLVWYGVPGRLLYAAVLWASYRSYRKGKLEWKGRTYPVGGAGASNQ